MPPRWQQIEQVYNAVLSRPEHERASVVAKLCESDATLRKEVESLLAHEAAARAFLETPALATADLTGTEPLIGRQFGSYSIVALLGVGGMGEIYRAHDQQLGRDVAIKILPRLFAGHPERLARFRNEARMLAALNHPHIGAIYGHEDVDGGPALVLELVDGETLADRIAKGPLPLTLALTIARQIADALDAAHKRGIVHRDLKPANIKITPEGVVKVLDFGLAKLGAMRGEGSGAEPTHAPVVTPHGTRDGMLLGTPAYMSPEQAGGTTADQRSDLWAFGVVVLEMLSGRLVFTGSSESAVLTAVVNEEPDWTRLPADTPDSIRALLRRCLEKDRGRRLESAAVARLEIDDTLAALVGGARARQAVSRRAVNLAASAAVLAAAITAWMLTRPAAQAPASRTPAAISRFPITTPEAQPPNVSGADRDLTLSPDGGRVVYRFAGSATAGTPLALRALDQIDAKPIKGVDHADAPFFSHDGQWIGYFENGELKKVSLASGEIATLCRVTGVSGGASWGVDGTIVFATDDPRTGLWSVPAEGGEPTVLTTPDPAHPGVDHMFPSVLPKARAVLFTIETAGSPDSSQVAVLDLRTRQVTRLVRGGHQSEYVERLEGSTQIGYLVFAAANRLRAVRFDPVRLATSGDAVTLEEQVMMKPGGAANYAVSRQGTLVHVPPGRSAGDAPRRRLVWVDRRGGEELVNQAPPRSYGPPRLAPDGRRVAVGIDDRENTDIWIWDLARLEFTRVTDHPGMDALPAWTSDGRIVFMSDRGQKGVPNLYVTAAERLGTPIQVTTSENKQWPESVDSDGHIFGFQLGPTLGLGIFVVPLPLAATAGAGPSPGADVSPSPLIQPLFRGTRPEISPDRRYVAYESEKSGTPYVYVRRFPLDEREPIQVSRGSATRPVWSPTGRELFYLDASGPITVVAVDTSGPTLVHGAPRALFDTRSRYVESKTNRARHFDVSRDGQRFLMIKDAPVDPNRTPAGMVVVQQWIEEVKERVH